jgi:signal transduction histidine kinase
MVALFEPATSEFRIAYFVDEIDGDQTGIRFPLGRGLTSYVVQSRQAQLFSRDRLERMSASGEIEILGNLSAYSWMGAPLLADEHLFGVIIIQSYHPDLSYTDADLELLSFVASHVAAALARLQASEALGKSNRELTETLQALTTAQSELIHQEKLASLGRLVAGVAHEINTPLGIVVTATSHLAEEVQLTRQALQQGTLTQKMLDEFFDICDESLRILTTNSQRGAALVRSFKQVAVDQSHDAVRHFDLKRYLDETLLALQPKLRLRQVKVELDCPEHLQLHTYPGALSQILTNLVMNSLTHGLESTSDARISVLVRHDQETVFLEYEDNGSGMSAENLQHLFEPFFTTRRGQGGSGLGAHIVYNLVTGLLGGQIRAHSAPDQGLRYEIRFPKIHKSVTGT